MSEPKALAARTRRATIPALALLMAVTVATGLALLAVAASPLLLQVHIWASLLLLAPLALHLNLQKKAIAKAFLRPRARVNHDGISKG